MTEDCKYCGEPLPWDDPMEKEPEEGERVICVIENEEGTVWTKTESYYHIACFRKKFLEDYEGELNV